MTHDKRPHSPDNQIYRPQLTSVLSISHRLTGIALTVGALLLVSWLLAAAAGPQAF
jgi:succinate dehydrogenase / fumarate reductase cytochrome b subunit